MMKLLLSLASIVFAQVAPPQTNALVARYVDAVGGEAALRAVQTRVTEGRFDNGRGLKTRFRIYQRAPNKWLTVIGTDAINTERGSGRGFNGSIGWDKNFVGTGLRLLEGRELNDTARDADLLRPLHLLDDCTTVRVDADADHEVAVCDRTVDSATRFYFNRRTGLLSKQETATTGRATIAVVFDDYRSVDGLRLPFKTQVTLPGASVTYVTESVKHNDTFDERVFERPGS